MSSPKTSADPMDDDRPLTPEEEDAILAEENVDVAAGLQRAMNVIAREKARRAMTGRESVLGLWAGWLAGFRDLDGDLPHRSRAESLARIRELAAKSAPIARQLATHAGYQEMSEAELNQLAAALEIFGAAYMIERLRVPLKRPRREPRERRLAAARVSAST